MKKLILLTIFSLIFFASSASALLNLSIIQNNPSGDISWRASSGNPFTNGSAFTSADGVAWTLQSDTDTVFTLQDNTATILAQQTSSTTQLGGQIFQAQTIGGTGFDIINLLNGTVTITVFRTNSPGTITVSLAIITNNQPNNTMRILSGTYDGNAITTNGAGQLVDITMLYFADFFAVDLFEPDDNLNQINQAIFFNTSLSIINGNLTNATINIWNVSNNVLINETTNILTGESNESTGLTNFTAFNITLPNNEYIWNVFGCSTNSTDDIVCGYADVNRTFVVGIENITSNFTGTVFETDLGHFNITFQINGTPTGALHWNGTRNTATVESLGGNLWRFLVSFLFNPSPTERLGTKTLFWEINANILHTNTTIENQEFNQINLTICGSSPQDVPYINFTYQNETTTQETVRASIASSEWFYYLSSSSINKTLSFSDTTERLANAFCFAPGDRTVSADVDYRYVNAESQQRTFNPSTLVLTNLTSNQTLFLLPTGLSLFSPFNVVTPIGTVIPGVKASVTRTLGGTTVDITSAITDASGFVGFFLNPDVTYSIVFSKSGLTDVTVGSYNPKSQTTTVVMGTDAGIISNGTGILTNTTLEITPLNNSLPNNTIVTFGFNVTSSLDITLISMNITNSTGGQLGFTNNAGQGIINVDVDTGNLSSIVGRYIVQTADETISVSKVWTVGQDFIGDYSLFRQLRLFNDYGFSDFMRMLLVIAFISGVLIFLSTREVLDTSESKIAVALLLIWAFSIVSWLNTGLIVNSASNNINTLAQFSNQFGIAILSTGGAIFFIFRKVFT